MPVLIIAVIGLTACVWDVRTRRIPNALTLGAAAAGIVFQVMDAGWSGLAHGLAGWALGVALFFPFFALRGMGAGDVKLLGAFGAWLGPARILYVAMAAALIGAAIAIAIVVWGNR